MDFQKCTTLIAINEELKLKVYDDATGKDAHGKGKLTIGYGRNLEDRGLTITECEFLLKNDIFYFYSMLMRLLPFYSSLDDVRQAVILDICLNCGVNGLMQFKKMLSFVENKNYQQASREILDSDAARKLKIRYEKNSNMMLSGDWILHS